MQPVKVLAALSFSAICGQALAETITLQPIGFPPNLLENNIIDPLSTTIGTGNPSYGSIDLTVPTRGQYYVGNIPTAAPYGSTISGVELTLYFSGGDYVDLQNTFVYFCKNEQTECHQFTGTGRLTTNTWDGIQTWRGRTSLSPGWELLVGIPDRDNAPIPMTPIKVEASISMGWVE